MGIKWDVKHLARLKSHRAVAYANTERVSVRMTWFVRDGASVNLGAPDLVSVQKRSYSDGSNRTDPAERGVTTSALRDAEPLIVQATAELPDVLAREGIELGDPLADVRKMAESIGTPRSNPDYYPTLLAMLGKLKESGDHKATQTLEGILDVSRPTLDTRLRTARKRERQQELTTE